MWYQVDGAAVITICVSLIHEGKFLVVIIPQVGGRLGRDCLSSWNIQRIKIEKIHVQINSLFVTVVQLTHSVLKATMYWTVSIISQQPHTDANSREITDGHPHCLGIFPNSQQVSLYHHK